MALKCLQLNCMHDRSWYSRLVVSNGPYLSCIAWQVQRSNVCMLKRGPKFQIKLAHKVQMILCPSLDICFCLRKGGHEGLIYVVVNLDTCYCNGAYAAQ